MYLICGRRIVHSVQWILIFEQYLVSTVNTILLKTPEEKKENPVNVGTHETSGVASQRAGP